MSDKKMKPATFSENTAFIDRFPFIPESMKKMDHWVCLKEGSSINPTNGLEAAVGDPDTWASFEDACQYAEQNDCTLGFELGRDSNITAVRIMNCMDHEGIVTNDKARNVLEQWKESYGEFDPEGNGITLLFEDARIPLKYDRDAEDDSVTVQVSEQLECIPITGRYCDEEIPATSEDDQFYTDLCNRYKLTNAKAFFQKLYEEFFGINDDAKIVDEMEPEEKEEKYQYRLNKLLKSNPFFRNLWNRSNPTEKGTLSDELNIIARLVLFVTHSEIDVCKLFKQSPYFRAKSTLEQSYYANIREISQFEQELIDEPEGLYMFDADTEDDLEDEFPFQLYLPGYGLTNDPAKDETAPPANEFASPHMRMLLDKAKQLLKRKGFAKYDSDYDFFFDSVYEDVKGLDSDYACAMTLLSAYGDRMKYCSEDDCWYVYHKGLWICENNKDLEHIRKYGAALTARIQDVLDWLDLPLWKKKKLRSAAKKFANVASFRSILEAARSVDPVGADFFNNNNDKLKVSNGTIDLKNGHYVADDIKDYFTRHSEVNYCHSHSEPKQFMKFLDDIFEGNKELLEYVRRVLGYLMTGETKEQKFFVFYGKGANGKSTLLNILQEVLNDYYGTFDSYALALKREGAGKANPTLIQNRYARMAVVSEKNKDAELDISLIKAISGGDRINTRMLFQNNVNPFYPTYKLVFATNFLPNIDWFDHGIVRRYIIIPFNRIFNEEEIIRDLDKIILKSEKELILKWLIDAAKSFYMEGGLGDEPEIITETKEKAMLQDNSVYSFAKETLEVTRNRNDIIQVKDMLEKYNKWCYDNGVEYDSRVKSKLLKVLKISKPEKLPNNKKRCYFYVGVKEINATDSQKDVPQDQSTEEPKTDTKE